MASATSTVAAGRGRLPVQGRDRRAALSALALLLVVLGALGSALVVYRSGHRTDVLVAAHDIRAGQQVDASDFRTVRLATDGGNVVRASSERAFLGAYARTEIPGGTLINDLMFQATNVVPSDGVVVGVTVAQNQRPATTLSSGDVVRAFNVPKNSSSGTPPAGTVLVSAARVVDVSGGSSGGDTITVSLLVTQDDATSLVAAASQGTVSLAVLPKTTAPVIDFAAKS
jgi:Flp pilus assembly protein CpaB